MSTPPAARHSFWQQAAAIMEILGVYTAGQFLAYLIAQVLGIQLVNPLQQITTQTTPADLRGMLWPLTQILLLQYLGWFLLIIPINWFRGWRKAADYGLTRAQKPLVYLVAVGVVLFAASELLTKLIEGLKPLFPALGETAAWREALLSMNWNNWEFWALMAIGSYGLIPIVEELFYRGYCQRRLEEACGAPAAILGAAFFFMLAHSQYFNLNLLSMGILISGVISALAWGYVFYRTRSLLATIVAHILVNIPMRGFVTWVELAAMLLICVVQWRAILGYLQDFFGLLRTAPQARLVTVSLVMGLFSIGMGIPGLSDLLLLAGIGLLLAAIGLQVWAWRAARKQPIVIP